MVYAIRIIKGFLHYLTLDKYATLPFWSPAPLFDIFDNTLPLEWYYNFFGYGEQHYITAIWGYKEMVFDEAHHDALIEREDEAIRIFLKRKKEIDEYIE